MMGRGEEVRSEGCWGGQVVQSFVGCWEDSGFDPVGSGRRGRVVSREGTGSDLHGSPWWGTVGGQRWERLRRATAGVQAGPGSEGSSGMGRKNGCVWR